MNALFLVTIPAFDDNYLWLLHDGQRALVVDPGDAAPVLAKLSELGLQLDVILVTHHHADHVGGVAELRSATGAKVFGPAFETMPEPITRVGEGDRVAALGIDFAVMEVPGHTAGHIAYFNASILLQAAVLQADSQAVASPVLFCGDTLFSGGCGRLFEGSPAQMLASLSTLAALPDETLVCCAHEYTLSNLKFALAVDPANAALIAYRSHCESLRARSIPTIPCKMGIEKQINPFLRSSSAGVKAAVQQFDPTAQSDIEIFAALRQWKNNFK
jgi:hydroxyacylglutathione hydrolase